MFVQTEITPNPNSLKFLPGKTVSNDGSFEVTKKEEISNKIKKAKTDPMPMPSSIKELIERPEAENLLGIYSSLSNQNLENSVKEFNGKQFSEFKEKLSEILIEKIEPISKEIKKLLNDEMYLDEILLKGPEKADKIASKKIKEIKELVGF